MRRVSDIIFLESVALQALGYRSVPSLESLLELW